ncbi:MAG: AAA family ATPase [Leptolinea sp.]|jgi:cellulose biosynthesis protein BcsQ|nr:AAA family ATPase [Leptolinea sp.]
MITTFTSMKGGTGKTTITGLMANFLTQFYKKRIIIIDIDPQGGSTTLYLGSEARTTIDGKAGPTVFTVLETMREGGDTRQMVQKALIRSKYNENVFVLPADYRVTSLLSMGESPDILKYALEEASFSDDLIVMVDTGTAPFLVSMAIAAATDKVFVPLMLSMQNRKPTADTIQLVLRQRKQLAGIVPVGIGNAKWEEATIDSWSESLKNNPMLANAKILAGIPYSKTLVRSEWVDQVFPERLTPVFSELSSVLLNGRTHAAE